MFAELVEANILPTTYEIHPAGFDKLSQPLFTCSLSLSKRTYRTLFANIETLLRNYHARAFKFRATARYFEMKGWMYIIQCSDGSLYTGSTNNLELRLWQHNEGLGAVYTKKRRPVVLLYAEEFANVKEAYFREKQIQGWTRKKKFALIEGRFEDLMVYSKSKESKCRKK